MIHNQTMIYGHKSGDIYSPNSISIQFVTQPLGDPTLTRSRHREYDPPIADPEIRRPPKTKVFLKCQRVSRRKTVEIRIAGNNNFIFRARTPRRNSTYLASQSLVLSFGSLRLIGAEFSKFVE